MTCINAHFSLCGDCNVWFISSTIKCDASGKKYKTNLIVSDGDQLLLICQIYITLTETLITSGLSPNLVLLSSMYNTPRYMNVTILLYCRFFPVLLVVMGLCGPLISGALSSGAIAFVYRAASLKMSPLYACLWGVGQTLVSAAVGFTRILATL